MRLSRPTICCSMMVRRDRGGVRARVRGFIEAMLEEELAGALSRPRYCRLKPGEDEAAPPTVGVRHGPRKRGLTGTFGRTGISVLRASAWRKRATGCSRSSASRRANGGRSEPRTRSSDCTRSSSAGSRPRPCCSAPKPPPCCSGRCSSPGRSPCARSTDGRSSPRSHPNH